MDFTHLNAGYKRDLLDSRKNNAIPKTSSLKKSSQRGTKAAKHAEDSPMETTAEKVLCDFLFASKATDMRARAIRESAAELERIDPFVAQRSRESVEQELSKIIVKLIEVTGPSPHHRMVAYSNVSEQILSELESMLFDPTTLRLREIEQDYLELKAERDVIYRDLTQDIAARNIEIARLKDQNKAFDEKLQTMSETNTSLQLELEKLLRDRIQIHQSSVELRMQGLDFKAEVDRRSGNILSSVQARMGFVPVGIEKQIELLRALKAPGDPSYDRVRQFRSMNAPVIDAESFISSTGGSMSSARNTPRGPSPANSPSTRRLSGGKYPPSDVVVESPASSISNRSPPIAPASPITRDRRSLSGGKGVPQDKNLMDRNSTRLPSPRSPANGSPASSNSKSLGLSIDIMKTRPSSAPIRRSLPSDVPADLNSTRNSPYAIIVGTEAPPAARDSPTAADSANIVRKLRSRYSENGKSRDSPAARNGISFISAQGAVTKSGSPVRALIDSGRTNGQSDGSEKPPGSAVKSGTAAEEDENDLEESSGGELSTPSVDPKLLDVRERRSSSGATSSAAISISGEHL